MKDRRPDPKPRKNPQLWQSYLWWEELKEMRKRHTLRQSSAERGKSNYDAQFEVDAMEHMALDKLIDDAQAAMQSYGRAVGPIWDWLTELRGVGDHTAAKLLAMVDDIGKFDTISKLWRFAGYGLYAYWFDARGTCRGPAVGYRMGENGERERVVLTPQAGWEQRAVTDRPVKGYMLPYYRKFKSEVYLVSESFMKQRTPIYREVYDSEKERIRIEHPNPVPNPYGPQKQRYTDMHVHLMALRKVSKLFLSHLWLKWREADGLPISEPWVLAYTEHSTMIEPPPG